MSDNSQSRYRDALADWMACAIGGADEPASKAARGAGDGLLDRIAAAGTAGHVLDYDDTYLPGLVHLSAPTAPTALVLGAERGASAAEALDAFAAGFEAAGAMARAGHPALYDGGWHPTAVCGTLGSAIAASRLLGLDAEAERSAAALALLRAGGFRSAFGSAGKSIQVGMAAATGAAAARIAAAGARLDLDRVVEAPAGFEQAFGASFEQPSGHTAIEQNWIKAYPCCLQTHAAIETAVAARDADSVGLDEDGPAIVVTVPTVALQAAWVGDPADGLEAKFSIPYLTAFALLHGAPGRGSFARVDEPSRRLGQRIAVNAGPALSDSEAALSVDDERVAHVEAPLGSPWRPMTAEGLAAKQHELAGERLDGAFDDLGRPAAELLDTLGS